MLPRPAGSILGLMVALAVAVLGGAPARADELRPVAIHFEQRDAHHWRISWKQPLASPADDRRAHPLLPRGCRFVRALERRVIPLAILGHGVVACPGAVAGGRIGWSHFIGQSDAIVRIAPLRRAEQVYRLTAAAPTAVIAARPATAQVWRSYFVIGVEHILAGWDHLLFVIALVLLVARGWPVIKAATAFTLAHSLTLAAVTLGFAGLPQRPVEALIALSIVFLAVELAKGGGGDGGGGGGEGGRETLTRRLPWLVAFAFGLLHGFGFAGALREIGLPEGAVPVALVSFNLGVEAGQLLVIAAVLGLRAGLAQIVPRAEPRAVQLATYAIGMTGAFWLVERLLG